MNSTSHHPAPTCRLLLALGLLFCAWSGGATPAPGDEHWDNQFGPVGANDAATPIAVQGSTVFVGGTFAAAGNTRASMIASYDGTNWHALGTGMTSAVGVSALTTDGINLYAVGGFDKADGVFVGSVARWDGNTWYPLGGGVSGIAGAIKIVGTNIYVGGLFTSAGGVTVNSIARWNGSTWSALGSGLAGSPLPPIPASIDFDGTYLYVAGVFNSAGGVAATNLARWDGASWSAVGPSLGGSINVLLVKNGKLYVGGAFTNAIFGVTNLAVWDGSSWSSIGAPDKRVRDIVSRRTDIYIGGDFTNVAGVSANGIARWDGCEWNPLGSGVGGFPIGTQSVGVWRIAFGPSDTIYITGRFNVAGNVGVSYVAGWDGTNWFALGGATSKGMTHYDRRVQALLPVDADIYAGGTFTEAGVLIAGGVARWNATNWSALGGGIVGAGGVQALADGGGVIYAGGTFTNIGGVDAGHVAAWNGTDWLPLASGLNSNVNALVLFRGTLLAGGAFTARGDGSGTLPGIAQWDGAQWQQVPTITAWRTNNVFNALATDGTNVFAGGKFYIGWIAGTTVDLNNIGRWDGTNWWTLGTALGTNATVSALLLRNGALYAGGTFTNPTIPSIQRIARWDGSVWTGLGDGFTNGSVLALAGNASTLYAAGTFSRSGGTPLNRIARWDGTNWSALGSGLLMASGSATGQVLAVTGDDVYVGGLFNFAGDKPAMSIARWNEQLNFYPPPHPELTRESITTNGRFRFRLAGTSGQTYVIQASTNLRTWAPLLTNTVTLYDYTDSLAPDFPLRFYRAVLPQ